MLHNLFRPIVPELNVYGEIVTMIDPNADVINDPTVQALLESMDGERTIVRYYSFFYEPNTKILINQLLLTSLYSSYLKTLLM